MNDGDNNTSSNNTDTRRNTSSNRRSNPGISLDTTNTQPEVDNLYLDMNGIIHPCCHPIDRPTPQSLDDMFNDVFEYVDVLINIVKPKKLIYLAIDGVAPRAKMNQQRSRRFRAALEAKENKEKESDLKKEWAKKGLKSIEHEIEGSNKKKFQFDSNTITPGTEFMDSLSEALELYVSHRMQFDPKWKDRVVIFSNASVPGEGEHKILEFIRYQRSLDSYNPNISHCIYGADADLIMLSLITHELNFTIIRESINDNTFRKCEACGKTGHGRADCPTVTGRKEDIKTIKDIEFSIIKISVLREYLMIEFRDTEFPFGFDFERVIDDFIFLCFFVGNDFLPHLPSMKIREGGIDALIYLYKQMIPLLDGYLTEKGKINLGRTEIIFKNLALIEDEFFHQLSVYEENQKSYKEKKNKMNTNNNSGKPNPFNDNARQLNNWEKFKALNMPSNASEVDKAQIEALNRSSSNTNNAKQLKVSNDEELDIMEDIQGKDHDQDKDNELEGFQSIVDKVQKDLDSELKEIRNSRRSKDSKAPSSVSRPNTKETFNINSVDEDQDYVKEIEEEPLKKFKEILEEKIRNDRREIEKQYQDPVKLGQSGWKERYYLNKFSVSLADTEFMELIKTSYIEGLCWVFEYYYNGCVSWDWYYPFHYAPFVSDLVGIKSLSISFNKGEPFQPVEQLLSVLPPASSGALPQCLRKYMHNVDSEIIDFYPSNFVLDINGQPFAWMGVNLIPFIEEERIKKVVAENIHLFSDKETKRNAWGQGRAFISWDTKEKAQSLSLSGFLLEDDEKTIPNNSDLVNMTGLNGLKIRVVKRCTISSFKMNKSFYSINNLEDIVAYKKSLRAKKIKANSCMIKDIDKHFGMYSNSVTSSEAEEASTHIDKFFNNNSLQHCSVIKQGAVFPNRVVFEDNLDAFSKKNYKGDNAINLVKKALGISVHKGYGYNNNRNNNDNRGSYNNYSVNEYEFKNQAYDRSNNNNRAVAYDPREMNYLRKKQAQEQRQQNEQSQNNMRANNYNYRNQNIDSNIYGNVPNHTQPTIPGVRAGVNMSNMPMPGHPQAHPYPYNEGFYNNSRSGPSMTGNFPDPNALQNPYINQFPSNQPNMYISNMPQMQNYPYMQQNMYNQQSDNRNNMNTRSRRNNQTEDPTGNDSTEFSNLFNKK